MEEFSPTADQILDGYRLVRFIGRGGFGEVWLCRSEAMGDYRAIKFISTTNPDLLEKEYESLVHYRRAAAMLRSPHLIPIEHINRNAAGLYYVMPLADGLSTQDPSDPAWQPLSLSAKVHAQAAMPQWFTSREITALLLPVLQALQTLTEAGLVHRDVKPENILFFNGQPCLGDISLLGADAAVITRRGTPGYGTPSWYVGGHPDMYGIAATLYTLLTGNGPDKMGRAAFLWPPQGESSLNDSERAEWKRLHAVIRRATDEKVGERFVDFAAMAAAMGQSTPAHQPPTRGKHPVLLLAIGFIVLMAAWMMPGKFGKYNNKPTDNSNPQAPSNLPHVQPGPSKPRKIKIVDMGGQFESNREKIISHIGSILASHSSAASKRTSLDLNAYQNRSDILNAFEHRDYTGALESFDAMLATGTGNSPEPEQILFRCLLLKKLEREEDMKRDLAKISAQDMESITPKAALTTRLETRVVLLEALGRHEQGEALVTKSLSLVLENFVDWRVGTAETLYQLRARMRVLAGDYAGALADEKSALALPLQCTSAAQSQAVRGETEAQARQRHLNTMVMQWELLEQEFPQYADYLEEHGSPEPLPDLRRLDDTE